MPNPDRSGQTIEVRQDGIRLHVRRWPSGGPDVLLIHGLASSSHIWDLVAPRLVRLGLDPVAYDQRGHGRSSKPTSGYGFEHTAGDAAKVIRAASLRRPLVVGHSWGANVALELAARRPRLVSGAVLLDGAFGSLRERFDWGTARRTLAPPAFGGITVEQFLAGIKDHVDPSIPRTQEVEAIFLSLVRVDRRGRVHPRLSRSNHLKILHAMWVQDTIGLLGGVRAPTLVLATRTRTAEPDDFARAKAQASTRIRSIGPPVAFEWIEGIHDVPIQRPEAVARRIARFAGKAGERS